MFSQSNSYNLEQIKYNVTTIATYYVRESAITPKVEYHCKSVTLKK